MKNFKLLLATTAILSTALAMNVKADEPSSTTLNVDVELLVPDVVIPVQHIDFGKIIVDPEQVGQQEFSVTMDPATGEINDYDAAKLHGKRKNGQVSLAYLYSSKKTIELPSNIFLYSLDGHQMGFAPDFAEIYSNSRAQFYTKTYGIGGNLYVSSGNYGFQPGKYSGQLTVTVIADE